MAANAYEMGMYAAWHCPRCLELCMAEQSRRFRDRIIRKGMILPSGGVKMSARDIPTRSQVSPAKRPPPVNTDAMQQPLPRKPLKPKPKNGGTGFDPEAFLAKVGLDKNVRHLKKTQIAYAQGDAADAIFYVRRGQLRVTVISAKGKEATLALVRAGEFLGENCMVSAHPLRLATATAMTECVLLRISKPEMIRVLHQEQELSEMFVSFLLARNARMQADLVDQLFNSSEKRLARILLLLAQFGKQSKPETVVPKISQEVLAEMIGT
ncbi:MAG: Crp/Fnr family transcriptional regulator, partial [Candidatus Korobacteraceae bacterium]